jgi:hypothetical protein
VARHRYGNVCRSVIEKIFLHVKTISFWSGRRQGRIENPQVGGQRVGESAKTRTSGGHSLARRLLNRDTRGENHQSDPE